MARHDYSDTKAARRYVARCAAAILSRDFENAYLYEDESDPSREADQFTVRRRRAARERLIARLRREGDDASR